MDGINPVLAQKIGLTTAPVDDQDAAPMTPTRQMRRALARAADKAVGLSTSVLGIAQDALDGETLVDTGPDGWVVLGLRSANSAGLTGLFMMDPAMRSALVEMQTMGNLLPPQTDQRKVTRTDAIMCLPFADQLMQELAEVGFGGSDFSPASYDMGPLPDLRTAGLVMLQGEYRSWRVTVQLGGGEAQGEILLAFRPPVTSLPSGEGERAGWSDALRGALEDAPTDLDAVLCRMALSINVIERFEVGQVLRLAGTTVGSVTLVGPDGKDVAPARLGQVAGKRAVKIQMAQVELEDTPAPPKAAAVADTGVADPPQVPQSDLIES